MPSDLSSSSLLPQKWLELASEHRSVRVALAALRLAVAAGAHMRKFVRRAGVDAAEELRLLAPQLVVLMVHHADADVRGDACRALQSFVRCLTPSATRCPLPSATSHATPIALTTAHLIPPASTRGGSDALDSFVSADRPQRLELR